MKNIDIKGKDSKIPLYVTVYETISQWLKDGIYKPGDKLPGENILAEQLSVSRGTLRQGLLLLQEDGLIMNHQGKGNIVLSNMDMSEAGMEKINNVFLEYCSEKIDRVDTTIGFQPPTQKHQEIFKVSPSTLIAKIDLNCYSQGKPMGFANIYMPYPVIANNDVDFEDTDTVYRLYNEILAQPSLYSDTRMRMIQAREITAENLGIEPDSSLIILEEEIYSEYDIPLLSQKLFFRPENFVFKIRRRNDRGMK